MPIDTSMYSRPPMINLDGADAFQQGMSMRNMIDQRQQQQAEAQRQRSISDAYTAGMTKDANGNISFDGKKTVGMIAAIPGAGKEAYAAQNDIRTQDAADVKAKHEKLLQHYDDSGRLAGAALQNPAAYPQIRAHAIASGLATEQDLPPVYDENFLKSTLYRSMAGKEQVAASAQQKGLDIEQQNANTKAQAQKDSHSDRVDRVRATNETKSAAQTDKDAKALEDHLAKGWAARSGQAGSVQGKINAAEAAEILVEQGKKQPGGLDSRQVEELAQNTARLLGGTGAASARVEALVPHTMWGKAQSLNEWLSNSPKGADLQAFTDRMADTVAREKALAQTQQKQYQVEGLASHSGFAKRNPDLYTKILKSKGIDPSMIDENGRYKAPPSTTEKPAWAK